MKKLHATEALQYLVENGLLYEINRLILHPFGLAIGASGAPEDFKLVLLDAREKDATGFIFDYDARKSGEEKYSKFLKKNQHILQNRVNKYNFEDQPSVFVEKEIHATEKEKAHAAAKRLEGHLGLKIGNVGTAYGFVEIGDVEMKWHLIVYSPHNVMVPTEWEGYDVKLRKPPKLL
jgi:hypothetical protein